MINKEALKTAGKVALTLVSPPVGLAYSAKKEKFSSFLIGLCASLFGTLGILYSTTNEQFRSSSSDLVVKFDRTYKDVPLSLFSSFTCPLSLPLISYPSTTIKQGNDNFITEGHNIITFNPDTTNYTLNFDENTPFVLKKADERKSVSEARKNLDNLVAKGDILGARKAKEDYTQTFNSYEQVRDVYSNAVVRMNDELKQLSSKNVKVQK